MTTPYIPRQGWVDQTLTHWRIGDAPLTEHRFSINPTEELVDHIARLTLPQRPRLADQEAWLHGSPEQVFACLKPFEDELTIGHKVSARVTSPKNTDAKLVEEVAYRGPVVTFAQSSIHQHSPR